MQQQSHRIDQDVALLAFDHLAGIEPRRIDADPPLGPLFAAQVCALHALTVDDAGGGAGLTFGLPAAFDVEPVMDFLQRAVVAPQTKVVVHRTAAADPSECSATDIRYSEHT